MYKEEIRNLAEVEATYQTCPTYLEWKRAHLICDILASFSKLKNLTSGSSYPSSNLYFMRVWKIESWLRAMG